MPLVDCGWLAQLTKSCVRARIGSTNSCPSESAHSGPQAGERRGMGPTAGSSAAEVYSRRVNEAFVGLI